MKVIGDRYRWGLFVGGFLREWFRDGDESRFNRLGFFRALDKHKASGGYGEFPRAELVDLWAYTKAAKEAV